MKEFSIIGKLLLTTGLFLILLGAIFLFGEKIMSNFKLPLGKLPGDIYIKKDNFTFFFPIVTCILLSIILTLILNLFRR